ncbi:hypothetical protein KHC33_04100 [Methanospirillum sp. J.3.6.1-F.2.7.3]|uniref:Uncharacterized protein n=1 Tax=Methanospirillum purgamenti TaxID=2834276 RepID=A0A8E7AYE0_9EURY|nr:MULTISPECIES: hypothetical protein [Methanospirillum]MDX8551777.1 hypothetical protein [Methanospirillum hungatei]QVV89705.1 hypothetical protein KHC33_04100 [Methanospirillum sp. J.3.6.1-F.2.7.3]
MGEERIYGRRVTSIPESTHPSGVKICFDSYTRSSVISTGFNIAHSPGGFLYQASHAIPPISLCISVEVLMNIIRSDLTAGVTASPQLADKEDRGERIRSYIELHPDVTAADIARSFWYNTPDSFPAPE